MARIGTFLIVVLVVCSLLSGCGGGGGGGGGDGGSGNHAPALSNLDLVRTVSLNEGNGTRVVAGSVTFSDGGGDLSSITLVACDDAGNQLDSITGQLQGATGMSSGRLTFTIRIGTTVAGVFHIQVFVTDRAGSQSNIVTTTLTISPWIMKAGLPNYAARTSLAVGVVNGKLYAIGGWGMSGAVAAVTEYDAVANTWTAKAPLPAAATGLAVGVVNGKLYAVGGTVGFASVKTLLEYDPVADTWTAKTPMTTARSDLAVGVVNGKLYAIGGSDSGGPAINTVEEYDPGTNAWTTKAPMPTARHGLAAGVVNGKLYAIGGTDLFSVNTVQEYDPGTNAWTTKAPMPTARHGLAAGVVNGKLYAIGGTAAIQGPPMTTTVLQTTEEYDPVMNTWTTKAPMLDHLSGLAAGVVNGKLYAVGGAYSPGTFSYGVEEYDPTTNP